MYDDNVKRNDVRDVITYNDDGTFEVLPDSDLAAVIGGFAAAAEASPPPVNGNCGCGALDL